MKNKLFLLGTLLVSAFSFSQNVFNTAPGSFVGIETSTPLVKFDVRGSVTRRSPGSENLAFFGTGLAGLYIIQKNITVSSNIVDNTILQFNSGSPLATSTKGFIEFNRIPSINTTISAISFGSNSSEFMRINQDGKVRIANGVNDLPTPNGYKLFVEEGILTEKVKVAVKTTANWSDYVFNEDYKLMPLGDVESFLIKNKHLPNVPSASEMVENGLDVAQMDAKLLEKVEELTLYIIEQNKQIEELKAAVQILMGKK